MTIDLFRRLLSKARIKAAQQAWSTSSSGTKDVVEDILESMLSSREFTDDEGRTWVQHPSSAPVSRVDALQLQVSVLLMSNPHFVLEL
jgi:hypothetical protein